MFERWRRSSLRFRILAATATASSVALILALVAFSVTVHVVLDNATIAAASDQASQVVSSITEDENPAAALRDVPAQGAILQLLNTKGAVLSYSDRSARTHPLADLHPGPGQTSTTRVGGIPTDENEPYVVVAEGLPAERDTSAMVLMVAVPLQTQTTLIRVGTLALGVLALLLLAGLLWLINRVLCSALGRVEQIRASVTAIHAARSEVRVPVPAGGDEITHLAQTMNDMLDRLHRADSTQRAFVSDASHELRSPLTAIRVISETSPRGIDEAGTQVISDEVLRMQHLVDDMLTLANADDRGMSLEAVEVDLDDLLIAEVQRMRASSSLLAIGDITAARVEGDRSRLAQALRNLVDNAMRHARTSVRLGCRAEGGRVIVTVDNDGDVIPADRRDRIFDRFTRLQQARDRDSGGSGLGLAIVHAIVQAHDGTVRAAEAPDGWCRFEVTLPEPR